MSGYQESVTDPSFARQIITFTYPHIGNYGVSARGAWSPTASTRARRSCARRSTPRTRRAPSSGWLDWLRDCGVPAHRRASTRARSSATSATRARCAAASSRRRCARPRRASASPPSRAWSGATSRARSRSPRRGRSRAEGDGPRIVALDTGIKRSIVRNFTLARRDARALPVHDDRRRAAGARPRRVLPRPGPRRPGRARLRRRHDPRAARAQAGVRHLPRPPAALPRRRPGDVQAPVRPPRRQPPGQGPARPGGSRSPPRTTASRSGGEPGSAHCRPTSARPSSRT